MSNSEINGIQKALNRLYSKKDYFGGEDNWQYIVAELSDLLPENLYFESDDTLQKVTVKKVKN